MQTNTPPEPLDSLKMQEIRERAKSNANYFFAINLRQCLMDEKTSQKDFAKTAGIGESSLTAYLEGKQDPSISKLEKIADALNVSCDYLLGRSKIKSPNFEHQAIGKMLGLDDSAINNLRIIKDLSQKAEKKSPANMAANTISRLLAHEDFLMVILSINRYGEQLAERHQREAEQKIVENEDLLKEIYDIQIQNGFMGGPKNARKVLSQDEYISFLCHEMKNFAGWLMEDIGDDYSKDVQRAIEQEVPNAQHNQKDK